MLLSVITPTFNRKKEIEKNIASVKRIAQNIECEHIIVDNLSTDGTRELIEEYSKKSLFPVIYFREPDGGIYDAINKGIKHAHGTWIHILNSDDFYHHDFSISEAICCDNIDYDIVACGIIIKNWKNGKDRIWLPEFRTRFHHYAFPHPGLFIKNSFYRTHGLYSTKYRIISDAVYGCEHYDSARIRIMNSIAVEMANDGVSGAESWQNYYEQLIMLLFYHKFPWHYKTIRVVKQLRRIIKFLIAERYPHIRKERTHV